MSISDKNIASKYFTSPQVYAVKHKDFETRMASRSGGIFTAVSDYVLNKNGIVYGCVLIEDFKAIHIRAENAEDRNRMRGSKYIQSTMGDVFKAVKEDLKGERFVLFSGTSCQIAGLQAFLQRPYEKLLCIDIVCHGVPSPKVWDAYLGWQGKKKHGKCVSVDFRNKRDHGWTAHIETLMFDNGKRVHSEVFKTLFYGHTILRPSCYLCPYKSVIHPGDITIADYWGIENAVPGFSDNKGVSLVLVNNKFGTVVFNSVKDSVEYRECRLEDSMQLPLIKHFDEPEEREHFWRDFEKHSFKYVAKKYGGFGFLSIVMKQSKRGIKLLRKMLKYFIYI
jgi:coenzyme F420-reducing hydrogenase beta subunit